MAEELNLDVKVNLNELNNLKAQAQKTGQSVSKSMQKTSQDVSTSMEKMSQNINKNLSSSIASITKTQLGFTALAYGITRFVSTTIKEMTEMDGVVGETMKPFREFGETLDNIKIAFQYLIVNALLPVVEELNNLTKEIGLTDQKFQNFADLLINVISQSLQIIIKQISLVVEAFKFLGNAGLVIVQAFQNIKGNSISPALIDMVKNTFNMVEISGELAEAIDGSSLKFRRGTTDIREWRQEIQKGEEAVKELNEELKLVPLQPYEPTNIEIGDAVRNLDELTESLEEKPPLFDEDDERITEVLIERLKELQEEYRQLESVYEGLGNVLDTTLNKTLLQSKNLLDQLAGAFLKFSFDLIKRKAIETKASEITATGSAIEAASKTAASTGNIFLLPAFITLATGFISSAFGSVKSFASGGIVSGSTLSITGEYPNAVNNPEVIAPLSKLKEYLGNDNINLTGQFQVEGQDLILAIDRAREIEEVIL